MDAEEAKLVQEYEEKLGIVTEDDDEKPKKKRKEKPKWLSTKILESELYDWDSTKRLLLLTICLGQRRDSDGWVPEDMPDEYKDDMAGWCDLSQGKLALRIGHKKDCVQKLIIGFETDGVIKVRRWRDSNNASHDMYHVNDAVVEKNQRPSQNIGTVKRPSRYKVKRGPNKGSFSSKNQPGRSDPVKGFDGGKR